MCSFRSHAFSWFFLYKFNCSINMLQRNMVFKLGFHIFVEYQAVARNMKYFRTVLRANEKKTEQSFYSFWWWVEWWWEKDEELDKTPINTWKSDFDDLNFVQVIAECFSSLGNILGYKNYYQNILKDVIAL